MSIDPRAGQKCDRRECINIPRLISDYFAVEPKSGESGGQVSFGTSGHRGISSSGSFNESHILAITQAVVEYRQGQKMSVQIYHLICPGTADEKAMAALRSKSSTQEAIMRDLKDIIDRCR